jgi:hypothetical protein
MHKVKTIIFIDWDDSLFPTSYYKKNLMNTTELNKLDNILNTLLTSYQIDNNIFIVSNASSGWLKKSIELLPKTQDTMIKNNIPVISARDAFIDKYEINNCKEKTFQVIVKNYDNYNNFNIVSIGDAHYEYIGLIKIDDYLKNTDKKYLLKNIKFINNPSYEDIINQLKLLNNILNNVITDSNYVDIHMNIDNKN